MSRKEETSQYNKYYHNDIKKQLGIDETRTASEKLLDKVIKVDKRPDYYTTLNQESEIHSEPKKKIKINPESSETPQTHYQILENKLFKNIHNQLNLNKLIKSLTILKKCLNESAFIEDPEINFQETWKNYTNKLINEITERNYCSSESFNIMSNIGDCIEILFNKFGQVKVKETEKREENDNESKNVYNVMTNEEVWISFCGLFTDDSFIFNKNLNKLKKFIFSQFDESIDSNPEAKELSVKLINKLILMPVKVEWVHTQLVKLFKEFNNNGYQNQLEDIERKTYLKNYNELLNKKPKSSVSDGSYNMMGNSKESSGLKTVHIEAITQNSNDKWVGKQ